MKKIPVTEQNKQMKQSVAADSNPSSVARGADAAQGEAEDPMAGLQGDLDRFRDLALRSQADFENYKKRSAREKEEAIKYANSSLL
jgi:molecular chaperone GrpE